MVNELSPGLKRDLIMVCLVLLVCLLSLILLSLYYDDKNVLDGRLEIAKVLALPDDDPEKIDLLSLLAERYRSYVLRMKSQLIALRIEAAFLFIFFMLSLSLNFMLWATLKSKTIQDSPLNGQDSSP